MFSLDTQYALVTGASRGIGRAIALNLAKQGAWVAGTSTTLKGANRFSEELSKLDLKGQGFVLNLADTASINQLINKLKEINKLPSILVNNAGITRDGLALRLTEEDWQMVLNVNLIGAFHLIRQCLPSMLASHYGRIINISSIVGVSGNKGQTSYAATKAGLIGLSKALALELANQNITVNTIAPGFIQTDMTAQLSESQRQHWLAKIPQGQLGIPNDIGYACIFLASKEARYITGHTLHVSGGLSIK